MRSSAGDNGAAIGLTLSYATPASRGIPPMAFTLSGPSYGPAAGGKPRRLVLLLHGLGADGNDLIGLAPHWSPLLPEAEFLSPNAPFPCDFAPYGYQWYSVQDRSPDMQLAGVRAAAGPARPRHRRPAHSPCGDGERGAGAQGRRGAGRDAELPRHRPFDR